MQQQKLTASMREVTGKKVSQLRRQGIVPAVLDQRGEESLSIQVPAAEMHKALHTSAGANVLLKLAIEGGPKKLESMVVVKKVSRNPISRQIDHVDFHVVSMTEKMTSHVPVILVGASAILKAQGGRVEQAVHELEISSLPDRIPSQLELDITNLVPGGAIHASEVPLPEGAELLTPADAVVALGRGKSLEQAAGEAAEAAAAAAAAE